jgi:hypothetical protein
MLKAGIKSFKKIENGYYFLDFDFCIKEGATTINTVAAIAVIIKNVAASLVFILKLLLCPPPPNIFLKKLTTEEPDFWYSLSPEDLECGLVILPIQPVKIKRNSSSIITKCLTLFIHAKYRKILKKLYEKISFKNKY